jgi:hypothetical protein
MSIRVLIAVVLILSCLMLVSPFIMSFSAVAFGQHLRVDIGPGSCIIEAFVVHPNDPGSGGGGTGVIR